MWPLFSHTGVSGHNRRNPKTHAAQETGREMGEPNRNNIKIANDNREEKKRTRRNNATHTVRPTTDPPISLPVVKTHRRRKKSQQMRKERTDPERTKRQKTKQKQLARENERKTLIKMQNAIRTMNTASLNPDSVKEEEQTHRDITKDLDRGKIHISAIEETHIAQGRRYLLENYRVATESATHPEKAGVVKGGTAVAIRESAKQHIAQIARQRSRVLRATLDRKNSRMPIQIISIYAPRNGHTEEDRRQHWEEVNEILTNTCKRHMIIWCADANGRLGSDEATEAPKTNKYNATTKIVGPYARVAKNGERKRKTPTGNLPKPAHYPDSNMETAETSQS